jgi:hypothetical protein
LDLFVAALGTPVPFSSVFDFNCVYAGSMDELEEALSRHEILGRFKKLLGREMTLREWQVFFLSDESTLSPRKNISSGVAVVVTS